MPRLLSTGDGDRSRSAQTALTFVFLIGTIVVVVAVTLAFIVVSFINSSLGFQAAQTALAVASSGAEDVYLQLDRNKDFSGSYQVPIGTYIANVNVSSSFPSSGQATAVSTATVANRTRKVQAVFSVDSLSGKINLTSWQLAL